MKTLLALVILGAATVIAPWSVLLVAVVCLLARALGRRLRQNQPPAARVYPPPREDVSPFVPPPVQLERRFRIIAGEGRAP